ncbi:hypothetical protein [Streptomyces sp. BpilaLS-43]|uniref:hypothetical protein n=1 Tax=Streptomyces sp. BpilaLS-43 TaxID=1839778 RepID=UPI00159F0C5E|nr:hypothetical protein [Streptomyces sp. BpilaLS-43]
MRRQRGRRPAETARRSEGAARLAVGGQGPAGGGGRLQAIARRAEDPGRRAPAPGPGWEPVAAAAEALRGEIQKPGGRRRREARGFAERLTGLRLGAAQDKALDAWGALYSTASGTLHGAGAEEDRPTHLYTELLNVTRELLVPLPGRAARVLELAALADLGPHDAAELARWTDPRAETFFFRSGPPPAWLGVLDEHAGHLLLADEENGVWPAAPFLEHLAHTAPETLGEWLAGHAAGLAAAGPWSWCAAAPGRRRSPAPGRRPKAAPARSGPGQPRRRARGSSAPSCGRLGRPPPAAGP